MTAKQYSKVTQTDRSNDLSLPGDPSGDLQTEQPRVPDKLFSASCGLVKPGGPVGPSSQQCCCPLWLANDQMDLCQLLRWSLTAEIVPCSNPSWLKACNGQKMDKKININFAPLFKNKHHKQTKYRGS